MKIYEKPMAIINKFEVEDVIAASSVGAADTGDVIADAIENTTGDITSQGVVFQW